MKLAVTFLCCLVCMSSVAGEDVQEQPLTKYDRDHWSFRELTRPDLPEVNAVEWSRNQVDHFILARLESADLQPPPEAAPATLLRRVKFDLLGLPPTPREIRDFLQNKDERGYERIVDRFLASPRYGEHWAQFWLDLARFAETDGFEHDLVRGEAWRYRDWVIRALNEDMPYDRFVSLQLAGDELDPQNADARIATAFCLSGPDMPDINSQAERRHGLLNELTSTVGSVLLGLQLGCAQCHDHKYDPISQADFYRMRAIFESAVQLKQNVSVFTLANAETAAASHVMLRGDYRRPGARIDPGLLRVADPWDTQPPAAMRDSPQGRRTFLASWLTRGDHPLTSRVIVNRLWQQHFGRGLSPTSSDFGVMGEPPTHPQLLDWLATELVNSGWDIKRLQRLIVNSATYRQASQPTSGDQTDQQPQLGGQRDPHNELLWRFPRRRLAGETIRDAMLLATDSLNLEAGGPGVMPELPPELRETLLANQWQTTQDPAQHQRRSIFVFARRNLRYPIFDAFDRPDANVSCARRNESTTANQALFMLNSAPSLLAARRLAGVTLRESQGELPRALMAACLRCYGREIHSREETLLVDFVREQAELIESRNGQLALPIPVPENFSRPVAAAMVHVCLGLLNANEINFVD